MLPLWPFSTRGVTPGISRHTHPEGEPCTICNLYGKVVIRREKICVVSWGKNIHSIIGNKLLTTSVHDTTCQNSKCRWWTAVYTKAVRPNSIFRMFWMPSFLAAVAVSLSRSHPRPPNHCGAALWPGGAWRWSFLQKVEKRQLWVRPFEWLKLNFASCVVHQTRSYHMFFF